MAGTGTNDDGKIELPEIRHLANHPINWESLFDVLDAIEDRDAKKVALQARATVEWLRDALVARRAGFKVNTDLLVTSIRAKNDELTRAKERIRLLELEKLSPPLEAGPDEYRAVVSFLVTIPKNLTTGNFQNAFIGLDQDDLDKHVVRYNVDNVDKQSTWSIRPLKHERVVY